MTCAVKRWKRNITARLLIYNYQAIRESNSLCFQGVTTKLGELALAKFGTLFFNPSCVQVINHFLKKRKE
jgi:hypothetical protein